MRKLKKKEERQIKINKKQPRVVYDCNYKQYFKEDKYALCLLYVAEKYLQQHRKLWDKENCVLNRFYKGQITRTINTMKKIIHKNNDGSNLLTMTIDLEEHLEDIFQQWNCTETGTNKEIFRTMVYVCSCLGVIKTLKVMSVKLKNDLGEINQIFRRYFDFFSDEIEPFFINFI